MTLGQHQEAFSRHMTAFLRYVFEAGYEVRLGEFQRTIEQERLYVQRGLSHTMRSNHLLKCAADLYIFTKDGKLLGHDELKPLGDFWESLQPGLNRWGGNWTFKDLAHFERNVA